MSARMLPDDLKTCWENEKSVRLEKQLNDTVVNILVAGEMKYRLREVSKRERLTKIKTDRIDPVKSGAFLMPKGEVE